MVTITSKISYTALGMAAGLLLALSIFGVKQVEAQAGSQYLVIPVNDFPFGQRGAQRYLRVLSQMNADGFKYDHSISGFVVFKK